MASDDRSPERLRNWLLQTATRARQIRSDIEGERFEIADAPGEARELAEALNEMLAVSDDVRGRLRRYVADAAHELQAPLAAMRASGELARTETNPARLQTSLEELLKQGTALSELIDRLLTLSRSDSGMTKLDPSPCDLATLARDGVAQLSMLADAAGHRLLIEAPAPVPARADVPVLSFALMNLIDNAIKYCSPGATIRVRAGRAGTSAFLEVADDGPGIAPEHQTRVFERFYRVDRGRSRELGGSGLGLSITQWAAEAHGGRVELQSELGRGSTFRIVLPAGLPAG